MNPRTQLDFSHVFQARQGARRFFIRWKREFRKDRTELTYFVVAHGEPPPPVTSE